MSSQRHRHNQAGADQTLSYAGSELNCIVAKKMLSWVCLVCLCIPFSTHAQEISLEPWLESNSAYSDPSELLELLREFEKHPLNLNEATEEQLAKFPLLNPLQARAIVVLRQKIGAFQSLSELSQIDLIDPALLPILMNYFTVQSMKKTQQWTISSRSRFSRKFDEFHGTQDSAMAAAPTKTYHRLDIGFGDKLRAGLLLEKDRGERRFDDLMIYFFSYHNRTTGNKLILGNYRLEFAQGLVFGDPYGYYKGAAANHWAIRRSRELLEYTIVDENASLYGVSAKLCFKIYQLFLFLSHNKLDASLNSEGKIKNFYDSGLHRTSSELAKKDQLLEQLGGTRIVIKPTASFSLGMTYYRARYSPAIAMQDDNFYRFAMNGKTNFVIGTDFHLTSRLFHWFGEIARSQSPNPSLITGMLLQIRPFEFVISYRNYSKRYINLHGYGFGERGEHPQNERGLFWGTQFAPSSRLKFTFYFDQFAFPWRTYLIAMPASGNDAMLQAEYRPLKHVKLTLQYHYEQKDHQISEIQQIVPKINHRGRSQIDAKIDDHITVRSRIEKKWVNYRYFRSNFPNHRQRFTGLLFYQDVMVRLRDYFHLALRLGWFDTVDYESRLYQFEHDVAGILTNQMLYGTGSRHYLWLQWQPHQFLQLSMKLATTEYIRQSGSGSKFAQNLSTSDCNLSFQMEIRW